MIKRFSNNLGLPKINHIFWQARFPERRLCIKCNHRRLFKSSDGRLKCKRCGFRFSVVRNTYLSALRLSLDQQKKGYHHQTIDHGKEEYVRQTNNGKAHINGIEGFWGYLKERLLKHHGVADRNLIFYVREIEFRFNYRHLSTE